MKVYTIKQKMSGTGSIHDIASDLYDRDIMFREGERFAVVLAAYYGGRGYTTHRTEEATIRQAHNVGEYSYEIIDSDGNFYAVNGDQLVEM